MIRLLAFYLAIFLQLSSTHSFLPTFEPTKKTICRSVISNGEKFEEENIDLTDGDADAGDVIRYRGRVAYDGSGFRGWQVQANGRTVQVRESFFPPQHPTTMMKD